MRATMEIQTVAEKIFDLGLGVKSAVDTDKFRTEVLNDLNNIQTQVQKVQDQLSAIKADIDLNQLKLEADHPETTINSWWTEEGVKDWFANKTPIDPDTVNLIKTNGKHLLGLMDTVIMRDDGTDWLTLAINEMLSKGNYSLKISVCEMAYQYSQHLFLLQLRCLACLAAIGDLDESYQKKITDRFTKQGDQFKKVAKNFKDKEPEKFFWFGGVSNCSWTFNGREDNLWISDELVSVSKENDSKNGPAILASAQFARGPQGHCDNQWSLNIAATSLQKDGSTDGWKQHNCGCGHPVLIKQNAWWNTKEIELPSLSVLTGIGFVPAMYVYPDPSNEELLIVGVKIDLKVEYLTLEKDGTYTRHTTDNCGAPDDFYDDNNKISTDWRGDGPFTGVKLKVSGDEALLIFKNDLMYDQFGLPPAATPGSPPG